MMLNPNLKSGQQDPRESILPFFFFFFLSLLLFLFFSFSFSFFVDRKRKPTKTKSLKSMGEFAKYSYTEKMYNRTKAKPNHPKLPIIASLPSKFNP